MSEPDDTTAEHISPAQFHDTPGTEGWHVLYGGAQALFPTDSLTTGATFAQRVAEAAADLGREPDIDLRPHTVAVCTARNRRGRLDRLDAELARRTSTIALGMGLTPDASRLQTIQIGVAESDGVDTSEFWRAALGYERIDGILADPLRRGPRLWFYELDKPGRGRTHLDVAVPNGQGAARAEAALDAGGRLASGDNAPEWWELASPDNHSVDIAAWGDILEEVM